MNDNIRIAKELVRIAKELTAANHPKMGGKEYDDSFKWFVVWYSQDGKALIDGGYVIIMDAEVRANIIADRYGYETKVFSKADAAKNGINVMDRRQWESLS